MNRAEEPYVIVSRKEMDTARNSLMRVYRMCEVERRNAHDATQQQTLDTRMTDMKNALIGLQIYEAEIMKLSEINSALDAQTGYVRSQWGEDAMRAISETSIENELRKALPQDILSAGYPHRRLQRVGADHEQRTIDRMDGRARD